ncbi:MAG TPA: LPXTG cell wall anchor domain-containing protein [Chitinophagaceae bacterium]|nr:LPXTG cell wall anchor domain-containing protein [Chitinophagaceae bacterium]
MMMMNRKRRGMVVALLILLSAGLFFYISYNNQQVRSEKDLYLLTDRFRDYNWSDNGKGSSLTFKLYSYKEKFVVDPSFLAGLKGDEFISTNMGDSITIGIPAYALPYLNTRQKRIPVYSIQIKGKPLLDASYTLKKKNSNALMIAGSLVLVAGLVVYFTKRRGDSR